MDWKKGMFFQNTSDSASKFTGLFLGKGQALTITSKGRSGFSLSNGPMPNDSQLIRDPVETITRYELKMAFGSAMLAVGLENPFNLVP